MLHLPANMRTTTVIVLCIVASAPPSPLLPSAWRNVQCEGAEAREARGARCRFQRLGEARVAGPRLGQPCTVTVPARRAAAAYGAARARAAAPASLPAHEAQDAAHLPREGPRVLGHGGAAHVARDPVFGSCGAAVSAGVQAPHGAPDGEEVDRLGPDVFRVGAHSLLAKPAAGARGVNLCFWSVRPVRAGEGAVAAVEEPDARDEQRPEARVHPVHAPQPTSRGGPLWSLRGAGGARR